MEQIFETASDLHVRSVKMYVSSGDLYKESDAENKLTADEVTNAFYMGNALIVDGNVEYRPVALAIVSKKAVLTYVKADASTATTAVLATASSK